MKHKALTLTRIGFYTAFTAYLALDLFVFHGPISNIVDSKEDELGLSPQALEKNRAVAVVYGEVITRKQLDAAVERYLLARNLDKTPPPKERLISIRHIVLNSLIDAKLLQIKTRFNSSSLRDFTPKNHDKKTLEHLVSIHDNPDQLKNLTANKLRLDARSLQSHYLEMVIANQIEPSPELIDQEWEKTKGEWIIPERRSITGVFIPSLKLPANAESEEIPQIFKLLEQSPSKFASLNNKISWHEAIELRPCSLLLANREELPTKLGDAVFSLEKNVVTQVKDKIGFYIFLVSNISPQRNLTKAEALPFIKEKLRNSRRPEVVNAYFSQLRKEAKDAGRLSIFPKRIEED